MAETSAKQEETRTAGGADAQDPARDNEENELQAEEESAAAMDSDVPQPPDASDASDTTTEGQPS